MKDLKSYFDEVDCFNKECELVFDNCDENKRATLGGLLAFAVDVAGKDFCERGLSHDRLVELKQVFLLSRYRMKIERTPRVDEIIRLRTAACGIKGPFANREFVMTDEKNDVIATASSAWVIVDPVTHKIKRPSAFNATALTTCRLDIQCDEAEKINVDESILEYIGDRRIVYSDLDGNGHLYSAKYGDIIMDFAPRSFQVNEIEEFSINYIKEAKRDEVLHIYGKENGNELILIAKHDDGLCFTSVIRRRNEADI